MKILGVSAFYHDSAAALIIDGEIVAAAQEERFTRKKFDASFPLHSIQFCLSQQNLNLSDIDEIVYYEKPFLSFERLLQSLVATAPKSFFMFLCAMPVWMYEKLNTRATIVKHLKKNFPGQKIPQISFSQHHLSHAASAFFASPFESAAVLCLDGVGEWATGSAWFGEGNSLKNIWEIHFPHSLGLLYSAFTFYCGFKVNSGEYKLMGLAPYGKPIYADQIKVKLIDIKQDGSFKLNMSYFSFASSMAMTNEKFEELWGVPPRIPEGPMEDVYKDLAASIQQVTEEIILRLARTVREQTGSANLCLAGGVALNCVANGLLSREKIFEKIWIQPAAGDAGGAVGAALASYYLQHNRPRQQSSTDLMRGALLGPSWTNKEIETELKSCGVSFTRLGDAEALEFACRDLIEGKVVGWFQGPMEYGPRALGARSILGDPRGKDMQSRMNLKIKFRESFRPFAAVVLADRVKEVFVEELESPYMLMVSHVRERSDLRVPAVTHVDGSSRLQTVDETKFSKLHHLIKKFDSLTGCPVLVNTSFNVRGEPIVCTPLDAIRCFFKTDMDSLFLENFYISKKEQVFDKEDSRWSMKNELD